MLYPHMQQGATWRSLDTTRHFVMYLFVTVPLGIFTAWRSSAFAIESQIAVVSTLKNLGKPLFQDYTREGRLIGIFLRIARVIAGSVTQIVVAILYAVIAILWYILPFYLLYQIGRNLGGL